jgi:serine/threonine protein kinase
MSTPTPDSRGAALKRSNDSMGDIRTLPSLGLSPYPSGGEATTTATVAAASNAAFRARLDAPSNLEETPSSLGNNDRKPSLSRLNSNASGASGRSSLDIPSGSARPVKRGKRDSWNNNHTVDGVNVEDFDDVDLAGISRKFPQEKRLELAARIDARAEDVAGAWAALLLAQTGMRYAEWATTQSRVEQTKQNTLRIVKAIVNYLVTASQAKLRQTISYIVAKRRRQGFGHEEVITSMLLLRRSFEKGCGPVTGDAGFLVDAVTRVMVGEVATYLHAIDPTTEVAPDVSVDAANDDDELGVERPEDVNLDIDYKPAEHVVEDVRPPMHLFIVPNVPAQFVRAREGGPPIMLAPLWSRAAHEPGGLWTWPKGTEPLNGAIVNSRFVIENYVASGSYGHGWKALDLQSKKAVFLKTPRASHDYMPSTMMAELARELGTMRRILTSIPKHPRLVNVIEVTPPHAPKPCALPSGVSAPIHYFACDLCEGGDLFSYVSAQPLEPMREPVVAHIFRQLMEAIDFLHGRNLFHRDLKTENVLVSREGGMYSLKVADFGRTVFVPPQPSETGEGPTNDHEQFVYDNAIFPAEAVRGGRIGDEVVAAEDGMYRLPQSDVWASGLILLLLTGVGRMSKIKHNIADALRGRGEKFAPLSVDEQPIDRLYRLVGPGWEVSAELDQVFRAMVHKDPMHRPTAKEVLECDWMQTADTVTEAEVMAAFERRNPVTEEAHNSMTVTCAPRLKETDVAFVALLGALETLQWPSGGGRDDRRVEIHVDRERLTATAVLGEMRIRAILTPVEGLLHKNPTKSIVAEEPDPMAAARKAEEARLRRDATATPVVRLVWIGGGSKDMNAMQLVNVYMHVSAIIST